MFGAWLGQSTELHFPACSGLEEGVFGTRGDLGVAAAAASASGKLGFSGLTAFRWATAFRSWLGYPRCLSGSGTAGRGVAGRLCGLAGCRPRSVEGVPGSQVAPAELRGMAASEGVGLGCAGVAVALFSQAR